MIARTTGKNGLFQRGCWRIWSSWSYIRRDAKKTRIISMRKANHREKQAYEEKIFFGLEAPPGDEG